MINTLTGLPIVREGFVRMGPLLGLREVAARRRVPLAEVLASLDLPPDLLGNAENTATVEQVGALLSALATATGCEHVALLASPGATLESMGAIGPLARGARDVGAALRGLILALHLHDRVTVPTLGVADGQATLGTVALGPTAQGSAYVADLTMVACFNILRGLCGPTWRASEVHLARRTPVRPRPWADLFRVPPRFNAERNALVFDAAWLKRPLAAAARPSAAPSLEAIGTAHPLDLPARVRRICVAAIVEGDPTVARVARLGGLSQRTLNRQLVPFGTTAQAELIAVKLAIARQLLEGTDLSLTAISQLLGYAEASAFTRAFRRREETSPSRWRLRRML